MFRNARCGVEVSVQQWDRAQSLSSIDLIELAPVRRDVGGCKLLRVVNELVNFEATSF